MNKNNEISEMGCFPATIKCGVGPQCPAKAVIPLYEVTTDENIKKLSNCFVHVQSTNRTYYIDSQHRFVMCWTGLVYVDDYDVATNPLNLKGQVALDQTSGELLVFNNAGEATTFSAGDAEVATVSDEAWRALWEGA